MPSAEKHFIDWVSQLGEGKNSCGNITKESVDELYALAFFLYQQKHYLEASHYFRLLAAACPSEAKYWKGLGATQQLLKDYDSALNCYASAQMLNGTQPDPYLYLHSADCYIALKETKNALKALAAAGMCAKKNKDQRVLQHVKLMQKIWSK